MKLEQSKTKPSTRSVLKFDEQELEEALKEAARKRGYIISDNGKCNVWVPCGSSDRERSVSLAIDSEGTEPGITKDETVVV